MFRPAFWITCVAMLFLGGSIPAHGGFVTYTPSGSFTPGSNASGGGDSVTVADGSGSVSIVFTPQLMTSVNSGTSPLLGTFTVTASSTAETVPTAPSPTTFALTIAQTTPTTATQSFDPATLSGTVSSGGGFLKLAFNTTSLSIGTVTYQLVNLTGNSLFLNHSGDTTLTALVTATVDGTAVPEPGTLTMTLIGASLLGLVGCYGRHRHGLKNATRAAGVCVGEPVR